MALVQLVCPLCGFSKHLEQARLPRYGTTVTCPKCQGQFLLEIGPRPAPVPVQAQENWLDAETPPAPLQPAAAAANTAMPEGAGAPVDAGVLETYELGAEELGAEEPPAPPKPPAAAAPAHAAAKRPRTLSFTFTGNASEYFGIWIVNTLLRIVTFGIYSPWAKVRKRRYFYANTLLDDATFDYLADPLAILKGWFIAGAFFGLYSFASRTSVIAGLAMGLVFMGLYPWVMVRSRMFNLRNSSHRNIRFSFNPNYNDAYKVYLWWSLLVPATLGLLIPYLLYRQKRFQAENSRFGNTPFRFHAIPDQYYRVFLPMLVLVPLALVILFGTPFLLPKGSGQAWQMILPPLVSTGCYLIGLAFVTVGLTNLTWSSTSLGRHRFNCTLRVRDMAWIYLSNAVAVLCTLGLLAPWAAVRMARYRLENLTLTGVGGLDSITAAWQEAPGATGEELGDMFGFDLGL